MLGMQELDGQRLDGIVAWNTNLWLTKIRFWSICRGGLNLFFLRGKSICREHFSLNIPKTFPESEKKHQIAHIALSKQKVNYYPNFKMLAECSNDLTQQSIQWQTIFLRISCRSSAIFLLDSINNDLLGNKYVVYFERGIWKEEQNRLFRIHWKVMCLIGK